MELASLGWEIAGGMGIYTILRNHFNDNKAIREKKALAFAAAVTRVTACEHHLRQSDHEVKLLAEIVKKSADLNVLVAGVVTSVKALETGLSEVKDSYRDLNKDIKALFQNHRTT